MSELQADYRSDASSSEVRVVSTFLDDGAQEEVVRVSRMKYPSSAERVWGRSGALWATLAEGSGVSLA